jgi:hypothetical protein
LRSSRWKTYPLLIYLATLGVFELVSSVLLNRVF